jgi:alpha-tubulin suppressor-like RCC1 family protein
MIAAGSNHSLDLTARYDVYSCGLNAKGQLDLGESNSCTVLHFHFLWHTKSGIIFFFQLLDKLLHDHHEFIGFRTNLYS